MAFENRARKKTSSFLATALFAGAGVAVGLVFLYIPNVELVTLTFFMAGYFLGFPLGMIAAVTGEFLYSMLNPLGMATPPLLVAQLAGMALAATAGSWIRHLEDRRPPFSWQQKTVLFGVSGFLLTFIYDLFTTCSFLIFAGLTTQKLLASLAYGMSFYVMHLLSNTLLFSLVLPVILPQLKKMLEL
jgi:hypothetical protein